jgi:hypothetical protein
MFRERKNRVTHTRSCFTMQWLFDHFGLTTTEPQLAFIDRARPPPSAIPALRLRDEA